MGKVSKVRKKTISKGRSSEKAHAARGRGKGMRRGGGGGDGREGGAKGKRGVGLGVRVGERGVAPYGKLPLFSSEGGGRRSEGRAF